MKEMKEKIFVASTIFVDAEFFGVIKVTPIAFATAVSIIRAAAKEGRVSSFCGHKPTADFLGVPVCRDSATLADGQVWYGIRPIKRPNPGEELEVSEENFAGFMFEVSTPA